MNNGIKIYRSYIWNMNNFLLQHASLSCIKLPQLASMTTSTGFLIDMKKDRQNITNKKIFFKFMSSTQFILWCCCQATCTFRCGISENIKHPCSSSAPDWGKRDEGRVRDAEGEQESISRVSIGRLYCVVSRSHLFYSPPFGC